LKKNFQNFFEKLSRIFSKTAFSCAVVYRKEHHDTAPSGGENGMYDNEDITMSKDEELVEVLLDFIIVAASLAKKVNLAMKTKQIKEGGSINGQIQRTGHGNQRLANCSREY
jgi:hypothetical protein